jgi:hypothetical protein
LSDWLENGIRAFDAGRHFEAHEFWEDLWRESTGTTREFIQGLVQVAVGLHHLGHGNVSGGRRVLQRGLERLESAPEDCCGIDNTGLINSIRAYLAGESTLPIRIRPGTPGIGANAPGNARDAPEEG